MNDISRIRIGLAPLQQTGNRRRHRPPDAPRPSLEELMKKMLSGFDQIEAAADELTEVLEDG